MGCDTTRWGKKGRVNMWFGRKSEDEGGMDSMKSTSKSLITTLAHDENRGKEGEIDLNTGGEEKGGHLLQEKRLRGKG